MKILRLIGLGLALTLLLAAMVVYFFLKSTVPVSEGVIQTGGIRRSVGITRDKWGIPSIRAESDGDLFFAIGFVHAQDRLFQMDLSRRSAFGRLSEVFGKRTIAEDIRQREMRARDSVDRALAGIPPATMESLRSYCAGVNAFIDAQNLPPEFHWLGYRPAKWEPADTLGVFKTMEAMLADSGSELANWRLVEALGEKSAKRLFLGQSDTAIIGRGEFGQFPGNRAVRDMLDREPGRDGNRPGSNGWVVSGKRTASGSPLLANDPHLSCRFPSYFYQIEGRSPELELSGNTIPGIPFMIIGRNRDIGWGLTAIGADVVDYFIVSVHPKNGNLYRFNNRWEPFETDTDRIAVRGGQEVIHEIRRSRFGPVFTVNGKSVARCSVAQFPATVLQAIDEMNRARDTSGFLEGLKKLSSPAFSVVFADRRGNIGYFPAGRIPVRARGDGTLPLKGEGSHDLWQGFLPEERKPMLINPEKGYIVTANNPVLGAGVPPVFSRRWEPGFRADRIEELIRSRMKLTRADMEAIQTDTLLKNAEFLIGKAADLDIAAGKAAWVMNILKNWNFRADEGFAPYLFYRFERCLARNIFADHVRGSEPLSPISPIWIYRIMDYPEASPRDAKDFADWIDDLATPAKETFTDIVEKSLIDTFEAFTREKKANPDNLKWENLHAVDFRHPLGVGFFLKPFLNRGPFALKGGRDSVMVGGFSTGEDFSVTLLPAFRMIIDFSDFSGSRMVNSSGQSGHFLSPFYDDQISPYTDRQYRGMEESPARPLRLVLQPR